MGQNTSKFRLRIRNKFYSEVKNALRFMLRNKTNTPYLSGDGFASLADCVFSERENIDFHKIVSAKILFVPSHLFEKFLDAYRDVDFERKILLLGNSDRNFEKKSKEFDKFLAVYCQNASFELSEQVKILPIGLENLKLAASGFKFFHKPSVLNQEIEKVLFPPMSPTNQIRSKLINEVESKLEIFDYKPLRLNRSAYFKLLKKYKFIFVCEGNGFDSHRLWEVLYQGSFPVVLKTPWSNNLKALNLPILYVDSLHEISLDLITNHYEKNFEFQPAYVEILWLDYWAQEFSLKLCSKSGN